MDTKAVLDYLQNLQAKIVEALELVDGKNFLNDSWQRAEGGGGTSCILEEGHVFERAGVGFSHVTGNKLPLCQRSTPGSRWPQLGSHGRFAGFSSAQPLRAYGTHECPFLCG